MAGSQEYRKVTCRTICHYARHTPRYTPPHTSRHTPLNATHFTPDIHHHHHDHYHHFILPTLYPLHTLLLLPPLQYHNFRSTPSILIPFFVHFSPKHLPPHLTSYSYPITLPNHRNTLEFTFTPSISLTPHPNHLSYTLNHPP